ncbi:MAG: PQQ-dependent sugar dehydrogenase [Anaerolineae bacterium]
MNRGYIALVALLSLVGVGLGACGAPERPSTPTAAAPRVQLTLTATSLPTAEPSPTPQSDVTPVVTVTERLELSPTAPPTVVAPPKEAIVLPEGFGISVFADGLLNPRMMAVGPDGALYVAERGAQRVVRLPDVDGDGLADGVEVVAEAGLQAPSSLAFHADGSLYVGDTTRVLRFYPPEDVTEVWTTWEVVIDGLPSGGHTTRTVLFSPDYEHLFVSIGSSCNVCVEEDARRATIMRYAPEGGDGEVYVAGLRNAVGLTFRPGTEELWATNNGRDWMGDDQPPETVYRLVEAGVDAGWPRCHAGRIIDPDFGAPGACEGVLAPAMEMQAHSAPLGLTFYTGGQFPAAYRGDLFVAFHGSWNRTEPTGYKVVRIPLEAGQLREVEDFAVGWLRSDGSYWGRPVDVVTGSEGSLFVSDDHGGRVYRIFYAGDL